MFLFVLESKAKRMPLESSREDWDLYKTGKGTSSTRRSSLWLNPRIIKYNYVTVTSENKAATSTRNHESLQKTLRTIYSSSQISISTSFQLTWLTLTKDSAHPFRAPTVPPTAEAGWLTALISRSVQSRVRLGSVKKRAKRSKASMLWRRKS